VIAVVRQPLRSLTEAVHMTDPMTPRPAVSLWPDVKFLEDFLLVGPMFLAISPGKFPR